MGTQLAKWVTACAAQRVTVGQCNGLQHEQRNGFYRVHRQRVIVGQCIRNGCGMSSVTGYNTCSAVGYSVCRVMDCNLFSVMDWSFLNSVVGCTVTEELL